MNLRRQYGQQGNQLLIHWTNRISSPVSSLAQHKNYRLVGLLSYLALLAIVFMGIAMITRTAQAADATTAPTLPLGNEGRAIQIVGGQQAEPGEWPWQAYVRSGPYMCGGTLIQQTWVVTAAHCVLHNDERYTAEQIHVTLGEHDRTKTEGTEQQINIIQVIPHPDYDAQSNNNDIALLQLATPATLGNGVGTVAPVITPGDDALVATGTQAMVTGWGATREGGPIATELMEVTTPLVTHEECSLTYGTLTGNMLCAGYAEGGKDACQGDSGGPLVVPTDDDGWKLAGIVSFGYGCARANFYGVYTRVSNYVPWMEQTLGISFSTPSTLTGTDNSADNETPTVPANASATLLPDQATTLTIANSTGTTLTLEIPVGSVESETLIDYGINYGATEAITAQPSAFRLGGIAFTLNASRNGLPIDRLTFNQALTLTIRYTENQSAEQENSSLDEAALTLFAFQPADGQWSTQSIVLIEHLAAEHQLVVALTQTGQYALGEAKRLIFLPIISR